MKITVAILPLVLAVPLLLAQRDMGGMSHDDMANMPGMEKPAESSAASEEQMSHHHLDMGPHMKMTTPRPATQADKDRAAVTVATSRDALEKYKDYKAALADGYKIFLPNLPTKMKHFTNNSYAMENAFRFNAA